MKAVGVIFLVALLSVCQAAIPEYIHVCKRTDPEIDTCIKNAILDLREELGKGLDDIGVPSIEPFRLDELQFVNNPSSVITNLDISGLSVYEIEELKAEVDKTRFAVIVKVPQVTFKGQCKLDLKILVAQLKGEGPISGKFIDVKVALALKGRKFEKDGATYLKFDPIKTEIFIDNAEFQLENIFGDSSALNKASQDLINDNPRPFLDELIPSLEHAASEKLTAIANKITTQFTFDELFPEA